MASGPDEEMVTFRLASRDRAAIQKLVESGEFRNRSDFLRYAVKSTLVSTDERMRDEKSRPKLDLHIEGVDLPPQNAPRKGTPRTRSGKGVNL